MTKVKGTNGPAPIAWSILNMTREFTSQEIEQRNDHTVKTVVQRIKKFLLPNRLSNDPTVGVTTVRVIKYPVSTQWI